MSFQRRLGRQEYLFLTLPGLSVVALRRHDSDSWLSRSSHPGGGGVLLVPGRSSAAETTGCWVIPAPNCAAHLLGSLRRGGSALTGGFNRLGGSIGGCRRRLGDRVNMDRVGTLEQGHDRGPLRS